MTWLFSKALCESWHCSQGPEAESSEGIFSDGEPYAQLNVMPTPHKFSRNDKTMDASRLSQFGLTLRLLTDDHGEELLTWFRAGFPAKTSPQPEKAPALTESAAVCGEKWRASFARYDRALCSWKTPQYSILGGLDEFSETWPKWGLMRNGECWERQTLERRTLEKEFGSWPTPRANDAEKRGDFDINNPRNGLPAAVKRWPTPTASASKGSSPASLTRKSGADRSRDRLDHAVMASDGGQLNPPWVEWLMGWPIGWTELRPLEMARFHEWRQQHSICLAWEKIKGAA